MPIYEYYCSQCGNEFEKLLSISDPDVNSPECPDCQAHDTHRRLSRIASLGGSAASGTDSGSGCATSGGFR